MKSSAPIQPPPGTRPPLTPVSDVPAFVRGMFERISGRYDLANHLLSLGTDFYWRRRAMRELDTVLARDRSAVIVDVCCGTGDMALTISRRARRRSLQSTRVFGTDFSHGMLVRARTKSRISRVTYFEADALRLPLADNQSEVITTAFGFRNLSSYREALSEFLRVLKPGGKLVILEFSQPTLPVFRTIFEWYFSRILPQLGGWITGDRNAYRYLHDSVQAFPSPEELTELMLHAGYHDVHFKRLTGSVAVLHTGIKPVFSVSGACPYSVGVPLCE
jgi:demethylmenaquinone methyltransferase/2-methoxy-6-polyprenyl-1,4-benzoquinol methylase